MDLATVDHLLTTTRSVRKRLDLTRPVEPEVIERCLEIAVQAPTGSNLQGWHFLVITDADDRRAIADHYRDSFAKYATERGEGAPAFRVDDPRLEQAPRVVSSAMHLAKHMHEVPAMILGCIHGRVEDAGPMAQASVYGSILPAMWSLMLALRSRGVGAAWTTLHLRHEREVAARLGIPDDVTQAALLPIAYFTGDDFRPAERLPLDRVVSWGRWGSGRAPT